jgi:hypothetical protein
MKRLHAHGILVQGCFAFGGDDEDKSVFEQTAEMITKIKIDLPRYSILTPFPNTQLYNELDKAGGSLNATGQCTMLSTVCSSRPK